MTKDELKVKTGQYYIDEEMQQMTFYDSRYYLNNKTGNYLPSASTILDAYPKGPEFFKWLKEKGSEADNIRDLAAAQGSFVHKCTEMYDNGEVVSLLNANGTISCSTREWAMFERYVQFSQKVCPIIKYNELSLVSEELGFGGTLDRIMEIEGKNYLMDIKTSNVLHNHYWLQLTAYKKLFNLEVDPEFKISGVGIIWLNAKTRGEGKSGSCQGKGWQVVFPDKEEEHYWKLFQHTQTLWLEENNNYKPNNLTYKLEHKKSQ